MMAQNTICLWYERDADEAGDALTVDFTVAGIPCIGLNVAAVEAAVGG